MNKRQKNKQLKKWLIKNGYSDKKRKTSLFGMWEHIKF